MDEIIQFVTEKNGQPITTSRKVAEAFGKRHDHILRDISKITEPKSGVSKEFAALNFEVSSYKDSTGRKLPEYNLTRDGFTILVMGYTGAKAMKFKEAYIQQFNRMESFIKSLQTAKLEFPAFTNAIMDAHTEPKHYHFSNEINMINRIVLGMTASQFKEANRLDKKVSSIRPYLALEQIQKIEELQRVDIGLIVANMEYEARKNILENHFKKRYLVA